MKENRRDFIRKTISLAAMSVGGIGSAVHGMPTPGSATGSESAMQEPKTESKIRIATQPPADATVTHLSFYKQMGLKHVVLWTDEKNAGAGYYMERKKFFEDEGLQLYGINNNSLINDERIVLNLAGRDQAIEQYKQHLRDLGKAGVTYTTYAHMGNGIWNSENETARSGASAKAFNLQGESIGVWGDKKYTGPLSHGREYTVKEMWANFDYFIKAVIRTAEENNVKIGILPDEPPVPKIAGVPRLFSHFDGFKRALEVSSKSPNLGVCLSIASWTQGGKTVGKDTLGMIEYFGKQKKLFKVRAGNVNAPVPHYTEAFVDSGYADMYKVMKALKKINFDGIVIADHIPVMIKTQGNRANQASQGPSAYDPGLAWTIGYIKSLRDRVEAEG